MNPNRLQTSTPMRLALAGLVVASLWLTQTACTTTPTADDAMQLALTGRHEQALQLLAQARQRDPADHTLRSMEVRLREAALAHYVMQAESARSSGQIDTAQTWLQRAQALDATQPRVRALAQDIERGQARATLQRAASDALAAGQTRLAEAHITRLLAEQPGDPAARALQRKLRERQASGGTGEAQTQTPAQTQAPVLAAALQARVSVEFRDAPLRSVLEGLGRTHGINFVFDRDVKPDTRVNLWLRDTPVAEALRLILSTQQLASKTLNERTLFIYPDTTAKQREHRELVTRSFYLANADVKQAQALVRTMAKTRDIHIDERLNQIIVRDTPEVVRLVERLLAAIDLPEPEVVLEVEVLEIASTQLDELGLQWPEQVQFGVPGLSGLVELGRRSEFRGSVANPALLATLRQTLTRSNTLANPRLRARNRDKAKVLVGEKLPVFTTTSTANGFSSSVSYLDVGLKLEVEPSVQLEGDVVMKVSLEVSTLKGRVAGPQGSVGYQVGTREASTTLRLRDGETQILAGLIRNEDAKGVSGLPGLAAMPIIGRLFGLHTDDRNRSEVVLLITPRVVRNIVPPDVALGNGAGGSEASPGDTPLRLSDTAAARLPPRTAAAARAAGGPDAPVGAAGTAAPGRPAALNLAASASGTVGGVVSVTLANRSDSLLEGEISFDATLLQAASQGAGEAGRAAFRIEPGRDQVVPLRVLPAAAGQTVSVTVGPVAASNTRGETSAVVVEGEAVIQIGALPAQPAAKPP